MRYNDIELGGVYINRNNGKKVKVFALIPFPKKYPFAENTETYVDVANLEDCPINNEYLPKTFTISCYDLEQF